MAPKAFVSSCWSSLAHEQWVIALATQLRENGVDVILDKWDLKEGHDAVVFMERMVTDPEIRKVVVVLDRLYAEKADGRKGGVGTETQIISAEVYKKADQDKFVGVIAEKGTDGTPFLPTYYKSRIYIDLSDSDSYANNFDQLLRWIFDEPLHRKPDLGRQPEFLKEDAITFGTQSRARRAVELLRVSAQGAQGAVDDYLSTFADGMEKFRISRFADRNAPDDEIVASIDAFLPYRNEFIEIVSTLGRCWPFDGTPSLQKFLENAAIYMFGPPSVSNWSEWEFDNFRFVAHELFLYTIALLIKAERFGAVSGLVNAGYYLGEAAEDRRQPIEDFCIFRHHLRSLEHRNQRLKLRRLSLHADMPEKRSHSSGLAFRFLMQSDFLLYLRSCVTAAASQTQLWWPETLVYAAFRHRGPFEIFARAQSATYFERIRGMLGVKSIDDLREVVSKLGADASSRLYIPGWEFDSINPAELANLDKLVTKS
ncbi:MAG: TIR domain-containing protein [Xanthobacteraceae bacterium]